MKNILKDLDAELLSDLGNEDEDKTAKFAEGWNSVDVDFTSYADLMPSKNGFCFGLINRPGMVFWSMDEEKAIAEYQHMDQEGYYPYWMCGKEQQKE